MIIHLFCCVRIVFREGGGWYGECVGAARCRLLLLDYTIVSLILLHTEEMIFLAPNYIFNINIYKYNI